MSTERYEMPHPLADQCAHAGVGKACKPCRERLAFIEAARVEASRYWLETLQDETVGIGDLGQHMAEWARTHLEQQEPTDTEVEAAANAIIALVPGETEETADMDDIDDAWDHARAALSAARTVRRDDTSTTPAHRIRTLHAPDADGNCGHCTRGRVYPVSAPCETVCALAGGGEAR